MQKNSAVPFHQGAKPFPKFVQLYLVPCQKMRVFENTALRKLSDVENAKLQTPEGLKKAFEKTQTSMFQDKPILTDWLRGWEKMLDLNRFFL